MLEDVDAISPKVDLSPHCEFLGIVFFSFLAASLDFVAHIIKQYSGCIVFPEFWIYI